MGWEASMEGGEACGARGFGRNGAEAEVRGELSSAAMATAGDEPGQGEERLGSGIGETERRKRTCFVGWLSGDEKVRRGDAWCCRRRDGKATALRQGRR